MTPFFKFSQSADTSDEFNVLICSRIFNTKYRVQQIHLKNRHIQPVHRVFGCFIRMDIQSIPLMIQIHAEFTFFRW